MRFNSKALKEFDDDGKKKVYPWDRPDTLLFNIKYWLHDKWWDFVGKPIYFLKKVYAYAKLLWNDFDFDAQCLYPLIRLKLQRVQKALENGNAIQEDKDMKALKLAIKLLDRLIEDKYWAPMDRHDRKWGEMETWFEPTERNDGSSYWMSKRAKANTPELKEQEILEFRKAYETEDMLRERDKRNLFRILDKYIRTWWD